MDSEALGMIPLSDTLLHERLRRARESCELAARPLLHVMNTTSPSITIRDGVIEHVWPQHVQDAMEIYRTQCKFIYKKLGLLSQDA